MKKQLLEALSSHAKGQIAKHKANVEVYMNSTIGIGEHSGVMEEIYNWTKTLDEAESILETLGRNFGEDITKSPDQSFEAISG